MASDSWLFQALCLKAMDFIVTKPDLVKRAYIKWVHGEETRYMCIGKKSVASRYCRFAAMRQI